MKQERDVKPEQLEDLLRYRMEQAHETLREAEILLSESALRGTISRAYYASCLCSTSRRLAPNRHGQSPPLCVRLAQACPEHALSIVEGRSRRRGLGWGFLADR